MDATSGSTNATAISALDSFPVALRYTMTNDTCRLPIVYRSLIPTSSAFMVLELPIITPGLSVPGH